MWVSRGVAVEWMACLNQCRASERHLGEVQPRRKEARAPFVNGLTGSAQRVGWYTIKSSPLWPERLTWRELRGRLCSPLRAAVQLELLSVLFCAAAAIHAVSEFLWVLWGFFYVPLFFLAA